MRSWPVPLLRELVRPSAALIWWKSTQRSIATDRAPAGPPLSSGTSSVASLAVVTDKPSVPSSAGASQLRGERPVSTGWLTPAAHPLTDRFGAQIAEKVDFTDFAQCPALVSSTTRKGCSTIQGRR